MRSAQGLLDELKGTGIRAMRRLAGEAGLPLPEFHSDRQANEFKVTLFLHNLLSEEDYAWLHGLAGNTLGPEEAKVLIYARETGAVDNTACRDFSGLDTLAASNVLRRLRDRGLLEKQGSGSRTYYTLSTPVEPPLSTPEQGVLPLDEVEIPRSEPVSPYGDSAHPHMPAGESPEAHLGIPENLTARIQAAGKKPRQPVLRGFLRELCALRAFSAVELCRVLGRSNPGELTRDHLKPMREAGELTLLYPESEKHPHQAYLVPTEREDGHD